MPQLTSLAWALWLPLLIGQPALSALMVRSGSWTRWPSLFLYVALRGFGTIALLAITLGIHDPDRRGFVYFWTYWAVEFMSDAIQVWMLAEIVGQIAGTTRESFQWIRRGVWLLSLIDLIWVSAVVSGAHASAWGRASHIVLSLSESVNLAWLVTFLVAVGAWESLGIRLFAPARSVAVGFALLALNGTSTTWLLTFTRNVTLISNIHSALYLLCLCTWGFGLKSYRETALPLDAFDQILAYHSALESCVERIQRDPHRP